MVTLGKVGAGRIVLARSVMALNRRSGRLPPLPYLSLRWCCCRRRVFASPLLLEFPDLHYLFRAETQLAFTGQNRLPKVLLPPVHDCPQFQKKRITISGEKTLVL